MDLLADNEVSDTFFNQFLVEDHSIHEEPAQLDASSHAIMRERRTDGSHYPRQQPNEASRRHGGSIASLSSDEWQLAPTPASEETDSRYGLSPSSLHYEQVGVDVPLEWHTNAHGASLSPYQHRDPSSLHSEALLPFEQQLDEYNMHSQDFMDMCYEMDSPIDRLSQPTTFFTLPDRSIPDTVLYAPPQQAAQRMYELQAQFGSHRLPQAHDPGYWQQWQHETQRYAPQAMNLASPRMLQHSLPQPSGFVHQRAAQPPVRPTQARRMPDIAQQRAAMVEHMRRPHPGSHQARRPPLLPYGPVPPPASTSTVIRSTNKGGRSGTLPADTRAKISAVRKTGACWKCVLQRDSCRAGEGSSCLRCNGDPHETIGMYPLDCDRTKLPLLLGDFLPSSMTTIHQKQVIMKVMEDDADGGIPPRAKEFIVYLTSGFGPDLAWPMVEFKPKDVSVTTQFQFYQHPQTRTMEKRDKYSPPFAIKSLSREEQSFEQYLDDILSSPQHLYDFAGLCYLAESRHHRFQEDLLQTFCGLYLGTDDSNLKALMKRILRMLILTNIMVHTLTIVEDTLQDALNHLRKTPAPAEYYHQKHTSPKLANRQLKFFFANKREEIYRELLNLGQKTLRTSGIKDKTWMSMFVLLLGFAMVHEEIQSILQIQAVSKSAKGEMSWDASQKEAVDACRRIDEKFELLVALFQRKYRSHTWTSPGSFGNQTPLLPDPATQLFLGQLRHSLEQQKAHLEDRRNVPLGHEQQCNYTSRLVAKFLLPFLDLPMQSAGVP